MATHYAAAFTRVRGDRQQAVCGAWISAEEHSTEPNCEPCLDYLTAEAATDASFQAMAEEPVDRALLVEHKPFNVLAGYRPRGSAR